MPCRVHRLRAFGSFINWRVNQGQVQVMPDRVADGEPGPAHHADHAAGALAVELGVLQPVGDGAAQAVGAAHVVALAAGALAPQRRGLGGRAVLVVGGGGRRRGRRHRAGAAPLDDQVRCGARGRVGPERTALQGTAWDAGTATGCTCYDRVWTPVLHHMLQHTLPAGFGAKSACIPATQATLPAPALMRSPAIAAMTAAATRPPTTPPMTAPMLEEPPPLLLLLPLLPAVLGPAASAPLDAARVTPKPRICVATLICVNRFSPGKGQLHGRSTMHLSDLTARSMGSMVRCQCFAASRAAILPACWTPDQGMSKPETQC